MIMDLDVPVCKQLFSNFGPGYKVFKAILSGEAKARTQADIETLTNEVAE